MEVPVVAQIGHKWCCCGRAGDVDPIDVRDMPSGWLDDDFAIYNLMRNWIRDVIMGDPYRLKVVIIENILLDLPRKRRLCQVLLNRLKVNSVVFLPDVLMSCVASGVSNALVVDIGWENTLVAPVIDLRILENYMGISTVASRHLADELCAKFGVLDGEQTLKQLRIESDIELNDMRIDWIKIQELLDNACGIEVQNGEYDIDDHAILPLVDKVVKKLPVDVKAEVLKNIVIIGGISNADGFKQRLITSLKKEYPNARALQTLSTWQGGSIYTFHALMQQDLDLMEVKKDLFEKNGIVPDWHLQKFM
ncbi:HGL152Cp [Eremothecium sinecaudum]|uniref:HGL152Cp n=1 Tax=Eremothecium sinecaudum TaxID=45286 RepID=A0A109V0N7_9SACH|nr:HGL152Cp [Eremothecium sinecaudum]AMD22188.1 HGL152Cp [Eremothecium sinecaudum]